MGWQRLWPWAFRLTFAALLLVGLALRTLNLSTVQHFQGDQGSDYVVIMEWLREGRWPLLGPLRITGDHTIGPGYFYTIAPLLAATRFHPAAGAATIALLGIAAIGLGGWVLLLGTGSRAATLSIVALLTLSPFCVDNDRILWNPMVLPFGVAAMAAALLSIASRPLPGLAAAVVLFAILPQWHTTGAVVAAAAAPFLALSAWQARRDLLETPQRTRLACGGVTVAVLLLLYVPPLLYELKPGRGNLARWFLNTIRAKQSLGGVDESPFFARLWWLPLDTASLFLRDTGVGWSLLHHAFAALLALSALVVPVIALRRRSWAGGFLVAVAWAFVFLAVWKGTQINAYFFTASRETFVLLLGWMIGEMVTSEGWLALGRLAGWCLAGALIALAAVGTHYAVGIPQGRVWYGDRLRHTRALAEAIYVDARGGPFSCYLAEPGNYSAQYQALLWKEGARPENHDYHSAVIPAQQFGRHLYLVAGPDQAGLPIVVEGTPPAELVTQSPAGRVYRVSRPEAPFLRVRIVVEPSAIRLTTRWREPST